MGNARARFGLVVLAGGMLAGCLSDDDPIQSPDYTQNIAFDVETAAISGDFTLNTGSFPASVYQRGRVFAGDVQNQALTRLGETWGGGYAGIRIIKGTYDSVYGWLDGNLVPQNLQSTVATGAVIAADQVWDVDVPRVIVVPTFTVDGGAFPASVYESADFFLRPVGGNELIPLGRTHLQPADNVMVTPGTYDVIYSITSGEQLPQNRSAVVMRSVDIATTPHALNIEIRTSQVVGNWQLAVDGVLGTFPASVYEQGEFRLRTDDGDSVSLGPTHTSIGAVRVITGTYDLVYRHIDGELVPRNYDAVILADRVVQTSVEQLDAIVDAWTAIPNLTLNGGPFPGSVYETADLLIKDKDTGATTLLGSTHNPPDELLLVEGTYDTVYRHVDGELVPQNQMAELDIDVVVDSPGVSLDIDVDAVTATGQFALNGAGFVKSVYEVAEFRLYPSGGGAGILLGDTYYDPEPVVIVAGNYDVVYAHVGGSLVPGNPHHVLFADQAYAAGAVIDVNVLTRQVRPAFTLDGQAFPDAPFQQGDFYLRGNHVEDSVRIGASNAAAETTVVIRGAYDALYRHVDGLSVPLNSEAVVGAVQVN